MYSTANSSVGVISFMASMGPLSLACPPDGLTFAMVPSSRVGVGCVEGRRSQSHQPPKSQSHRVRVPVPPSRFGGKYLPFRKSPAPHVPNCPTFPAFQSPLCDEDLPKASTSRPVLGKRMGVATLANRGPRDGGPYD